MKYLYAILLSCSFFFSDATHLMGGEITVAELPNGQHLVNLIVYRDTIGIPMQNLATFDFQGPNGWSMSRTVPYDSVISGNLLPMYPYGVEVYWFSDTVTFPAAGQWHISWSNCCRNDAIQNLSNPTSENMYLSTNVMVDSLAPNSTAFFLVPAAIYLPLNTTWQYNPLPFDPDGDSLAWSLDAPLNAMGSYCAGYTTPPSAATGPLTLDSITGTISWTANTIGNFVLSILVDQYRNGVWIGEIRRDMQLIVVPAGSGYPYWSLMNGQAPRDTLNMSVPANSPLNFEIVASHLDTNKSLYMEAFSPLFQDANANISFSTAPTGNQNDLKGTFNFTPEARHAQQSHLVVFRCSDNYFTTDQTMTIEVTAGVGLEEQLAGADFANWSLYPNPAGNHFNITFQARAAETMSLEIRDLEGRLLQYSELKAEMGTNIFSVESQALKAGIYLVQLKAEDQNLWSSKMIKH